jgi:hypothetical protein
VYFWRWALWQAMGRNGAAGYGGSTVGPIRDPITLGMPQWSLLVISGSTGTCSSNRRNR